MKDKIEPVTIPVKVENPATKDISANDTTTTDTNTLTDEEIKKQQEAAKNVWNSYVNRNAWRLKKPERLRTNY